MSFVIDFILLVIIGVSIYAGVKRGFIKSAKGIVALLAALVLANTLSPILAGYLRQNVIEDAVTNALHEHFENEDAQGGSDILGDKEKLGELSALLLPLGIGEAELYEYYDSVISEGALNVREKLVSYIVEPIVESASQVAAYVIVFLLALVLCNLAALLLDLFFKLPVLSTANRVLGFAFGALNGLSYAWLASLLLAKALPYLSTVNAELFSEATLSSSVVFSSLYHLNPLQYLLFF